MPTPNSRQNSRPMRPLRTRTRKIFRRKDEENAKNVHSRTVRVTNLPSHEHRYLNDMMVDEYDIEGYTAVFIVENSSALVRFKTEFEAVLFASKWNGTYVKARTLYAERAPDAEIKSWIEAEKQEIDFVWPGPSEALTVGEGYGLFGIGLCFELRVSMVVEPAISEVSIGDEDAVDRGTFYVRDEMSKIGHGLSQGDGFVIVLGRKRWSGFKGRMDYIQSTFTGFLLGIKIV
ncbi:hypothetical protein CC80DRAFT_543205 [Byssothecium circinans]|uniref:Uncharacterized protein n=1 Tax=Byssothecium circinans TaxID=147558 RepID=A0A6A5UFZ4_9PLEO|nr:hypothetical protein CC80DRAFT_543205 [Byssothecium circinans]